MYYGPCPSLGYKLKLSRLLVQIGFAESNKAAKRLIEGKGVKIDGEVELEDIDWPIPDWWMSIVSVGKRKFARIVPPEGLFSIETGEFDDVCKDKL